MSKPESDIISTAPTGFTLTNLDNEFNSDNISQTKNAMSGLTLGRGDSSPTFIKNEEKKTTSLIINKTSNSSQLT